MPGGTCLDVFFKAETLAHLSKLFSFVICLKNCTNFEEIEFSFVSLHISDDVDFITVLCFLCMTQGGFLVGNLEGSFLGSF